ncbi:hypothetical protein P879_03304 [Paragonimus westermani]|uniref:Uncharacterized protein n=1 Tax=Paragonimus westermani TaxID=34504 RepID=A0A8T0DFC7_9TREM|nr:hypothetical protein P879_03304 [Paragonimus westermani]
MVQPVANGATSVPPVKHPLSGPLAESVLFGILCGLHVNGKNAGTNLSSLLLAGVRVYTSVDVSVACGNLRDLVTKVLISASSSDSMQSTQSVQQAVQVLNLWITKTHSTPKDFKMGQYVRDDDSRVLIKRHP